MMMTSMLNSFMQCFFESRKKSELLSKMHKDDQCHLVHFFLREFSVIQHFDPNQSKCWTDTLMEDIFFFKVCFVH